MTTCTACGNAARKTVAAIVTRGPGIAVPGEVCGECAATGVLIVTGDDRVDDVVAPAPAESVRTTKTTTGGKLIKDGLGLREVARGHVDKRATAETLPIGEARVLSAVVLYGGLARDQITTYTGYKRSTRDAYLQRLSSAGLVETCQSGVSATAAGMRVVALPHIPTGGALLENVLLELPEGEAVILRVLTESAVRVIVSRDEITRRTGYMRSTRDAYLQRLNRRRLVELSRAGIRAVAELFDYEAMP